MGINRKFSLSPKYFHVNLCGTITAHIFLRHVEYRVFVKNDITLLCSLLLKFRGVGMGKAGRARALDLVY